MQRERLNKLIKQAVRRLRKRQTKSEAILWHEIRNRQLNGAKFFRQYPIVFEWQARKRFLIADFYCHKANLVIELDGPIHEK
ncbi:DUF559 domain-containing protein [Candidatus Saganbacteria bacterium]|nr:DUF559 domain-containing protein [Candidatus Saganbacteria bacterium]